MSIFEWSQLVHNLVEKPAEVDLSNIRGRSPSLWDKGKAAAIADAITRIENGETIRVIDASATADGLCIGDFRDKGWVKKIASRDSLFWYWSGPTAIYIGDDLVQPNSYSTEIDMDWS